MDAAALVILTLLLGVLVILVAFAVGNRKQEIKEQTEPGVEAAGKTAIATHSRGS